MRHQIMEYRTDSRKDYDSPYLAYSDRTQARTEVADNKMVYDCGSCVVKYTLCGFNFVIFILSTVILGIGIWLLVDMNSFISLLKVVPASNVQTAASPTFLQNIMYVLIAIGASMFFISFLGYCGALRESRCMLTLYGILLIAILIAEITVVVIGVVLKSTIESEVKSVLKLSIETYYNNTDINNPISLGWNELQKAHNCCGVDGGGDYQRNPSWKDQSYIIPESCCALGLDNKPLDPNCMTSPTQSNSFYDTGCYGKVIDLLKRNLDTMIIVLVVLGLTELVEILFAFCLAKSINKYEK